LRGFPLSNPAGAEHRELTCDKPVPLDWQIGCSVSGAYSHFAAKLLLKWIRPCA